MPRVSRYWAVVPALALFVLLILQGTLAQGTYVPSGIFNPDTPLNVARAGASSAVLPDGRVLFTGGTDVDGNPLSSAEFLGGASAGQMLTARTGHISVTLKDGTVLVAGGSTTGGAATNATEIYNPSTGMWSPAASSMLQARIGATATLLGDGRVFIAGGDNGSGPLQTTEIYDPATGMFTLGAPLSSSREKHAAALLNDGRVVIAGGSNGSAALATVDLYDPSTNTVAAVTGMSTPRQGFSATTLLKGQVLLAGGNDGTNDLASTEILDAAAGTIAAGPNMSTARNGHVALLLPNNNTVLMASGADSPAAEIFIPWQNAFAVFGTMSAAHSNPAAAASSQTGAASVAGGTVNGSVSTAVETIHFAMVQTDKPDYQPGDTAQITGSGFGAGETVDISVEEIPDLDGDSPIQIQATADSSGNFSATLPINAADSNIRFYLTATGETSGMTAGKTFTDAPSKVGSVTVAAQDPNPVPQGDSATYLVTVNRGNPGAFTADLTFNGSIPAGATASFSPSSLAFSSSDTSHTSTLTISTTNPTTPSGTTTGLTVTATNDSNSGDNATSSFFSLVVSAACTVPTVTTSPSDQTVTYGAPSVSFTAAASGSSPTVQWQVSTDGGATFTDISGATGTTLTISNPTVAFNGNKYRARFTACSTTVATTAATLTVNAAIVSGVTLSLSSSSVPYGTASITLSGSLTSSTTVSEGTITFNNLPSGSSVTGTTTVSGGMYSATLTLGTGVDAATYNNITATYSDNNSPAEFTCMGGTCTSTPGQTLTVTAATTSTVVGTSGSPSTFGQSVTFTATVSNTQTSPTPTGNVNFYDAAGGATCAALGASIQIGATQALSGGIASVSTTTLSVAAHTILACFLGSTDFVASSNTVSQTVNPAVITDVTLTLSSSSVPYGTASITLSGSVTSSTTVSEGTITFNNLPSGSSVTGATTVSGGAYSATLNLGTGVDAGTYNNITATYSDSNSPAEFTCTGGTCTSTPGRTLMVTRDDTTFTSLSASQTITYGTSSIMLSGKLTGSVVNPPIGSMVSITINGTTVNTTTTDAAGDFSKSFDTSTIPYSATAYTITYGYSATTNFNGTTDTSTTVTVNQRPITFKADNKSIYFGQPAPTFTYSVTLGSIVNSDTFGTATYTFSGSTPPYGPSTTPPVAVGIYTIGVSGLANPNYSVSFATGTYTINLDTTMLMYTGPTSSTYGQCGAINLSAQLTNTVFGGAPVSGQTITFSITQGVNTVTLGTAVTDNTGTAYLSANVPSMFSAGAATVSASFAGSATLAMSSAGPIAYTINQATPGPVNGFLYTGATLFYTPDTSSNTASVALSTTVEDLQGCSGDISTAKVTFGIRNADGSVTPIPSAQNLPVGLVSPTNSYVGTATRIVQLSTGNGNAAMFDIAVIFGGNYNLNNPAYDQMIIVTKPGVANSITGMGAIDLNAQLPASGYLATGAGTASSAIPSGSDNYMQVAAMVAYNKSYTSPHGQVQVQFNSYNRPDGSNDYPVLHTYQITSNSISGLTSPVKGEVFQFTSKSNVVDITNPSSPVSVDGGATLIVTTYNSNYVDTNHVTYPYGGIAVEVQSKSGKVWVVGGWTGTQSVVKQQTNSGGGVMGQ